MSTRDEARASRRQLVFGLLVIPLSLLPFAAYASLTPEGQLLKDKAELALAPPELGALDGALRAEVEDAIPAYRDAVMPLVYHGVGSSSSGEGDYSVSPERFGEHLAALRAAGVHFVTPERVVEAFEGGRELPSRAVLLTFDDGRTDAMMWATPLLEQASASATMFVITGAAESKAVYYADWAALAKYDRGPWNLQSHTDALHVEHEAAGGQSLPALTSTKPGESLAEYRARVRADLDRADRQLRERTGRRPVAFAYPFGAYGADRTNDPAVREILAEEIGHRYELAFHQDDQDTVPLATAESDRLGLRRLSVGDWSGETLVRRIAAAARRTPLPGDELEVVPPGLGDPVVVAAPKAGPAQRGRRTVPSVPAPRVPATRSGVVATASRSAPSALRPPTTSAPDDEPTPTPTSPTTAPPTTTAPSPGRSGEAPGKRGEAPGQQR